jgi:hypothetical protein
MGLRNQSKNNKHSGRGQGKIQFLFTVSFKLSYAPSCSAVTGPWGDHRGQWEASPERPYLAHTFHASCHHNAGVTCPYGLGCKAHSFEAWPTDHLAGPRWNRVGDPCTHTGLSSRILPTTWKKEHRGLSAIKEKGTLSGCKCMQNCQLGHLPLVKAYSQVLTKGRKA